MTQRITVPDGKVAILLATEDADMLVSILELIGQSSNKRVHIPTSIAHAAKLCWFDIAVQSARASESP